MHYRIQYKYAYIYEYSTTINLVQYLNLMVNLIRKDVELQIKLFVLLVRHFCFFFDVGSWNLAAFGALAGTRAASRSAVCTTHGSKLRAEA